MRILAFRGMFVLPLLWVVAVAALTPAATAQDNDVAVIVNPRNPVANLTLGDLRKILMGEKRSWPNGARVQLIVGPPGSHERRTMLRLMGMSESEYKQYWTAQVFRGDADAEPVAVPSFGMVKEAVRVYPGAITLIDAGLLRDGMDVKVIKVDGHLPREPAYPLQ
jgi:ABC-type phosphate transport system substrate-binding protein